MVAIVAPILIIAAVSLGIRRSWLDFHSGLLGYLTKFLLLLLLFERKSNHHNFN